MLIDTHCHLDAPEFAADRSELVDAARRSGVAAIVVPAVWPANFDDVRRCCSEHPGCYPAYGTHPLYVERVDADAAVRDLRTCVGKELAGTRASIAIGEIGLDFFVPGFDAVRQEAVFLEQLKVARDFDLPVLLHVRRAVDAVLKCLRRIGVRGGIAHAFNGSLQQAEVLLRLGFKLGFGGAMTYPRATRLRALAANLPDEAIVLETDAPDIPPTWLAGRRNTPGELVGIAAGLAELRGVEPEMVARITGDNAIVLFGRHFTV